MRFRLALMASIAVVAAACGGGDGGGTGGELSGTTITFSVSLAEEEQAALQELMKTFESESGAKVNLTSITSADLPEKLAVEVAAGRPTIQLFAQDNLALRVLVDRDLVQPLDDYELPSGIIESLVPEKFDGKQYFLPFRPNVRIAYANKERFQTARVDPPETTEQLLEVGRALRRSADGQAKVTLSLAEGDPAAVTISEFLVSFGGNPLVLNDAGSVQAFEYLQTGWREGIFARESLLGKYDTEIDYLRGETAWLAENWPFTSGTLAQEGLLDRFDVYEGWRGPRRAAHVVGGDVLGVPKGVEGKQLEAALALARFLESKEAQATLARDNAWPSIREDAYEDVPSEQSDTFKAIQSALEDGWFRPNVAYWPDVSGAMNDAVRRILDRNEPVRPVLDELHGRIEAAAKAKGAEYPPPASPSS